MNGVLKPKPSGRKPSAHLPSVTLRPRVAGFDDVRCPRAKAPSQPSRSMLPLDDAWRGGTYVVEPGTRGLRVTLGQVADGFLPEGFGFKTPFITHLVR